MARTPLNENCSAVLLNKLPKKLGDPGRFLIPCEFSGINTCNALADLGASINLMPYSVWKTLSLPELTPTCMTLELADRSISEPIGIAEDVYVTVGKFQFPADFVVVDLSWDPPSTSYPREEFLKNSGLFSSKSILNSDPSHQPPNQGTYFPETRKDLKICEANSSVNEPPEVELKDLPPHLEYAFLEGDDKLPVIIAKDLKNEEKAALIEVLKSHKRAIAWKLSDIKGINPEFCTHKILMEEALRNRRSDQKAGLCDDFSVSGFFLYIALSHLDKMLLNGVKGTNLVLNWEKSHFMVKEGIVLGHKISKSGIEVDRAKVDVIAKLPHPTTVKGQRKEQHFHPNTLLPARTMTEAQAHYTTTEKELLAVVFGAPRAIISDRGTHFCNDQFAKVMLKYEESTIVSPPDSGRSIVDSLVRPTRMTPLWAFRIQRNKTPMGVFVHVVLKGMQSAALRLEPKLTGPLNANFDLSLKW
ncbi:reverse transcriptase domain-containing protein [Tanacetum coccineum]|uniref:Reverse transcriptase domain-containing protein n=1 Tax=Tanacetum coccineum TaxID=301880 RepID=A0ABQ4XL66_9ASTR